MTDITDQNILNLVSPGESNGDYNAVYGIPVGSSAQPNLSNMTISEVLQYQRNRIASGQDSSAVGKYQFIQSTLQETTRQAGLDPATTRFTNEVQDKLIITRLKYKRQYQEWKDGKISDKTFQGNLAREFASVPVPYAQQGQHRKVQAGESYYAGDGLNSANHVNAVKFSNSLAQVKTATRSNYDRNPNTVSTILDDVVLSDNRLILLSGQAAAGQRAAADELKKAYTYAIDKYMKNNPGASPYSDTGLVDKLSSLEQDSHPALKKQAEIIREVVNELTLEQQSIEQSQQQISDYLASPTDEPATSISVADKISPEANWYTSVDLPTYKWTLFLTTREVFDNPERYLQNETVSSNNASIISKSGVESTYSIDNFAFNSTLFGDDTKGSAQTSTIQFEIKEPMGFTLLDTILSKAEEYNFKVMKSATYVLKLEFQGRNPTTGAVERYDGIHYFPVIPYQVTSQTGVDGTSYMFTCLTTPSEASIESVLTAQEIHVHNVTTLGDAMTALEQRLNDAEIAASTPAATANSTPTAGVPRKTWSLKFAENATAGTAGFDLKTMPVTTSNSSGTARSMNNSDTLDFSIPVNSNLTTWLKDFITKNISFNEFVKGQSNTSYTTPIVDIKAVTSGTPGKQDDIDENSNQKYITVTLEIGVRSAYGVVRADGADSAQLVDKSWQDSRFDTMPIVKKYDYIYTGKNTEVLNYTAQYNNLFAISTDVRLGANTANSTGEQVGTNITNNVFLSDSAVDSSYMNVLSNNSIIHRNSSNNAQKLVEQNGVPNELISKYAESYANRTSDTEIIELDIIGDPYLLGIPGSTITGNVSKTLQNVTANSDVFIAFVSHFPATTTDNTFTKGPMDLYSSGIFDLRQVEHRFQNGQYTAKLICYRDHKSSTFLLQRRLEDL